MSNEASARANLEERLASNTVRLTELVNSQCDMEVTRSLVLCFSSREEDCAVAMTRALFAKGTRVLQTAPEEKADGRFHLRVGVRHSIREIVREEFVADMAHTAAAMNGSFDGWNLLADEPSDENQLPQRGVPDLQGAAVAGPQ